MLSLSEIKVGKKIVIEGEPFVVQFVQHSKMGRAGAVLRTKLKNLVTGNVINKTFQGSDKVKEAEMGTKKAQFLYQEGNLFFFMGSEDYEQFELDAQVIGDDVRYFKEGTSVDILLFKEIPINIELPIKMSFEVIEAPPAIKGNTADGGTKQVKIETGATITTPLFIETGDKIKVNTQTGQYAERDN